MPALFKRVGLEHEKTCISNISVKSSKLPADILMRQNCGIDYIYKSH